MRTRAAVLREVAEHGPYQQFRPLQIEELTLDDPGEGEVLLEITAAGLCHSDLSVVTGDRPRPRPMALGHEGAGIVRAVGDGVRQVAVGDHVVTVFVASCGSCGTCREGRAALCEVAAAANGAGTLVSGHRRLRDANNRPVNHHLGVSVFSQYAVVSVNSVVKVDPGLPPEHAALFGCAVLTGVGAVVNTAGLRAGQSVAIVGLGGVGLAALLGAVAAGARRIVAVDVHPAKLALARQLGATQTVLAGGEAAAEVRDLTDGGVDVAVETAGVVAAFETAYQATRRGGTTVTAGLPHPDARWSVPPVHLVAEERTIKGSYVGSAIASRDVPRYVELFQTGRLPVDKLLGDKFRLDDINVALDELAGGKALRQIVTMHD